MSSHVLASLIIGAALITPAATQTADPVSPDAVESQVSETERELRDLARREREAAEHVRRVDRAIHGEEEDLDIYDYNLEVTDQRLDDLHTRAAAKRARIALYRARLRVALEPIAFGETAAPRPREVTLVAVARRYARQIAVLEEDLAAIEDEIARLARYRQREFDLIAVAEGNIDGHAVRRQRRQETLEEIQTALTARAQRLDELIHLLDTMDPSVMLPGADALQAALELPVPADAPDGPPLPGSYSFVVSGEVAVPLLPDLATPEEIALAETDDALEIPPTPRGQGLEIETEPGVTVRAVRRGEVIYAAPLEGFGSVVIVDHDDGTLSVTGSLAEILVEVGDDVDTGEAIATAGTLRATGTPGVHFEVRADEETLDPEAWFGSGDLRTALVGD